MLDLDELNNQDNNPEGNTSRRLNDYLFSKDFYIDDKIMDDPTAATSINKGSLYCMNEDGEFMENPNTDFQTWDFHSDEPNDGPS